jgi:uncharacterized protein YgbK (DUF1537 family)
MRFGIVADDNTGASDAAGMLTEKGVRTALVLSFEAAREGEVFLADFDAVVLGTQIRSMAAEQAQERTTAAIELLKVLQVEKVQLKYCSTFDSTPQGNIGCSLDAGLEALAQEATIVAPALPVNGRTTYNGYHFVNGVLLSESPLRHHPLNPMTDSNLVRWLQQQTRRRVDVVRLEEIRRGVAHVWELMDSLVGLGASYLVTDAIEQSDLTVVAEATADWRFISGGSGLTAEIPRLMFPERSLLCFAERLEGLAAGLLVVSGSQSPATRAQNAWAAANGFCGVPLDPREVLSGRADANRVVDEASAILGEGKPVVIYARAESPEEVQEVQEFGRTLGLSVTQTGAMIADALAKAAARLLKERPVGRLIISGGETSGAVCALAGFGALEVGLPVEPGVPYCFPASQPDLMVVLKSGNFGSEDFYQRVMSLH